MNLAIIPARGGSKRIPEKNIKLFNGKPIIAYCIEAAIQAEVFDRIIVSTDSRKIADVGVRFGAEAPFLRPVELSDDHTPTAPVLKHAIDWISETGTAPERICCIYATAPFIRPEHIRTGLQLLIHQRVSAAFSVTTFAFPIFRALQIGPQGFLKMFWPEHETTRSNDLPEAYHDAGQFYWLETAAFLKTGKLYAPDALPVVIPRYLVQDIDTAEDWETAEFMFKALHLRGGHSQSEVKA